MTRTWVRLLPIVVIGIVLAELGAAASNRALAVEPTVKTVVGPSRLVSPDFGYAVIYRTARAGEVFKQTVGLFLYDRGRWRDVTPPLARNVNAIDDVTFIDRQHGWVAEYDCADTAIYLYGTSDGGRSWQSFGAPAHRSCGGGPTYLSFVDATHGWMEPLEPNAPGGALLQTSDGGVSWKTILPSGSSSFPCLAPMELVSRSAGWAARCDGRLFATSDAGRHWHRVAVEAAPDTAQSFDLPRFSGKTGAMAAILGGKTASKVAFFVSADRGRTWSQRALREVAACPLRTDGGFYQTYWPASVASTRVWWIVSGRKHVTVQVTRDAGRHWSSFKAKGLTASTCAMTSTTAAGARVAWAIASFHGGYSSALYATKDGGRTWKRVQLKPRVKLSP